MTSSPHEAPWSQRGGVRVWGVVDDRLIELRAEPASDAGFRIEGLPENRTRTTADRVRAALLNCRLVGEAPSITIRLDPPIAAGASSDLDLGLALAVLAHAGVIGAGLRWILATGRLGLDGTVHADVPSEPATLGDVLRWLCQRQELQSEHMFDPKRVAQE